MNAHHYIACDLGAESGRVVLGTLADGKVGLEEIYRFANGPVRVNGTLRWDVLRLFDELETGVRKVAARGIKPDGLSCDSWGVDYVWLKDGEPFLTAPFHYRDTRTDGGLERAFAVIPSETIFAETGIQFMTINTLYQLHADQRLRPWVFKSSDRFLNIGDYFNYLFSGVAKSEDSLASTTQLYNPRRHRWSKKLIRGFKFAKKAFPEVAPSGTVLGPSLPEFDLPGTQVIASCSHDTGAAVAAVPAQGKGWAYLSSGTWSLLGLESKKPIINEKSRQYNFTNEVGFGGRIRFLKNIIGLWIQQECRRAWRKEGREFSYEHLGVLAAQAEPLKALINPNAEPFAKPDNMPQKIAAFCRATGQVAPANEGEFIRCILESLALLYRQTLDRMEDVTGKPIATLHIVGGGSQNKLLNQLSANATGRIVVAGPVEATATGNVLIQAIALGHLKDLEELRSVVRSSFEVTTFKPQDADVWTQAYARFQKLT
ncbi:MAG TPA: rhamnulokinase family protein [Verrucomicrobiae bacterium]|nr:rhamnulokinase family protein [Verrucomicrobiae bacterium]